MISFRKVFIESIIHNKPFNPDSEKDGKTYEYIFEAEGEEYICKFIEVESGVGDFSRFYNVYSFYFGNTLDDGSLNFELLKSYGISITRRIFATIEDICKNFFETTNADAISFIADRREPTRVRFYEFLLRTLQKGYNYRYFSGGGKSIIFNPKIDGKKVDEFEKYMIDNNIDMETMETRA